MVLLRTVELRVCRIVCNVRLVRSLIRVLVKDSGDASWTQERASLALADVAPVVNLQLASVMVSLQDWMLQSRL
nr:MAG TPA: hypothetical protein [Bacteriophage sp.]